MRELFQFLFVHEIPQKISDFIFFNLRAPMLFPYLNKNVEMYKNDAQLARICRERSSFVQLTATPFYRSTALLSVIKLWRIV